jgi:hypothetical protein
MKEGAVESHAMVQNDEIALEREGGRAGEHHHPVGGRDHGGPRPRREVDSGMDPARLARVDPLGSEDSADPPPRRPDETLSPAGCRAVQGARGGDAGQLALPQAKEGGAGQSGPARRGDPFNPPCMRTHLEPPFDGAPVAEQGDEDRRARPISVEAEKETTVRADRHGRAVQRQRDRPSRRHAAQQGALLGGTVDVEGGRFRPGAGQQDQGEQACEAAHARRAASTAASAVA